MCGADTGAGTGSTCAHRYGAAVGRTRALVSPDTLVRGGQDMGELHSQVGLFEAALVVAVVGGLGNTGGNRNGNGLHARQCVRR